VLYDLAFLLMDLLRRHLPAHANVVFNRYVAARVDLEGLALLPLSLGCRAAIRAKTSATAASLQPKGTRADELRATARDYLAMAERLLKPVAPVLIAIGGFSGSGKSTLAARLAPGTGREPGALVLRSDLIRKRLFGVPESSRLGSDAYRAEASREVYRTMVERAGRALSAGHSVIADAVYASREAREAIARVAARARVPFTGLWLEASRETLAGRIDTRGADASDATREVLERQLAGDIGSLDWQRVDASGEVDATEERARTAIEPALAQLDSR
jgi:predicted kinase